MLRITSGQWTAEATSGDLSSSIAILYRSADFLIVNKRYDLKINSDDPSDSVTVATLLSRLFPDLVDLHAAHGFRFVNRLDYATSGCLCLALTKKGARWGAKAFAKRYVSKHYLALLRGHLNQVTESNLTVDLPIGDDSAHTDVHRMCTTESVSCTNPRSAQTNIVLLEHGSYEGKPVSKVLLVPHTGRTHQLRVHCSSIGHCVVGDYTYSERTDVTPYRMMLHAFRLVIPMKRERIDVTAADPFISTVDPCWTSSQTFMSYQDFCKAEAPS